MKIVKKLSTVNCHFFSREILLYIAWACFRNDSNLSIKWVTVEENKNRP